MNTYSKNDVQFPAPLCLICESAREVHYRRYREFAWVCGDCLPHLNSAEALCAALEQAHGAILGEEPA